MLPGGKIKGLGVPVPGQRLAEGKGSGIVESDLPRFGAGQLPVDQHVGKHWEISLHALTVTEAQIVPAFFFRRKAPGHFVPGGIKGSAVQEIHFPVPGFIRGQVGVKFPGGPDAGFIPGIYPLALNDDQGVPFRRAALVYRERGFCPDGQSFQRHRSFLHLQEQCVFPGGQFKQEGGIRPARTVLNGARERHPLRRGGGGDFVAVAVQGENAVVLPQAFQLHPAQFVEGNAPVHRQRHFAWQGALSFRAVGKPQFI